MTSVVVDIEGNNLYPEVSKIWVIAFAELDGSREWVLTEDNVINFFPMIRGLGVTEMIFHNGITYDIPTLAKIFKFDIEAFYKKFHVVDTLVMSRVLNPDRGGHSVEWWANFLKLPVKKVQHEDWSKYDPNMAVRCLADVQIQKAIAQYLMSELRQVKENAL